MTASSSPSPSRNRSWLWIIGVGILLAGGCFAVLCGAIAWWAWQSQTHPTQPTRPPWPTPVWTWPALDGTAILSPTPSQATTPATPAAMPQDPAWLTWQALQQAQPLLHDPVALYARLRGQPVFWPTPTPSPPPKPGTVQTFYVTDTDGTRSFPIQATLAAVEDHTYVWVDTRWNFDPTDAQIIAREFATHIYPTTRAFFGEEPSPGIDNDPHLYILFAQGVGSVAGYFSSSDALPPPVHPFSNAHEMFILSASMLRADENTYGVLAHEFQHMIHQAQDPDEVSWLNEGFSELAVLLNGYQRGFFDTFYVSAPDIPLLHWPDPTEASTLPYYGGGFLFTLYFLERFGEQATRELVREPANSIQGIQAVLERIGALHPTTGQPLTAEDVFLDWAIANLVDDAQVGDGRFGYRRYHPPRAEPTTRLSTCPQGPITGEVAPFGVDYLAISCPGEWELRLALDTQAPLWPVEPHSGTFALWSNYGDQNDMRLTRAFDFTDLAAGQRLTLTYWTWYDIEADYDYGYVLLSEDGGQTWTFLRPPHATDRNPVGQNYGWGYTGRTEGWVQEQVDLSPYAGQKVLLRFEYLTDAAVNHWGWLLDDIAIPEIGYRQDFEDGLGEWQAEGWVRAANRIPRTYRLALVWQGRAGLQVEYLPLDPTGRLQRPLVLQAPWSQVTLVLMDTTPFARYPARYRVEVAAP